MSQLSWGLYLPLLLAAILYALISIVAAAIDSSGDGPRAERVRDLAFGLALGITAYTAVLLVIALVSLPNTMYDMVVIVLIIVAFFALLLLVLFAVFELFFSRGERPAAPGPDRSE